MRMDPSAWACVCQIKVMLTNVYFFSFYWPFTDWEPAHDLSPADYFTHDLIAALWSRHFEPKWSGSITVLVFNLFMWECIDLKADEILQENLCIQNIRVGWTGGHVELGLVFMRTHRHKYLQVITLK